MSVDLNKLIDSVARGSNEALREIYDKYAAAFYSIAFSVLKDEKSATAVSAEAFRRIRSKAYRFEEGLNGEYWIFDVHYTLTSNKLTTSKGKQADDTVRSDKTQYAPEVYISIFSNLGVNEIASVVDKKKSVVSKILRVTEDNDENIRSLAKAIMPDYWEAVVSDVSTGAEDLSDEDFIQTEIQGNNQKRKGSYKRILAVILLVVFISGAVFGIVQLVTKNYGSDVQKNALGEEVLWQFNNTIAITELNGVVYFRGAGNSLYKKNMNSGEIVKISDDHPKEILNDGTYVYYRNNNDGYMYRIDADGANKIKMCDVPGTAMEIYGEWMYFSTTGGIYRIPLSGGTIESAELVFDNTNDVNLYCTDIEIDSLGKVFFSSGIGKGIHYITEYNGEPTVDGIFADEAYTILIDDDMMYFDYKEASGRILLYCFDIEEYLKSESGTRIHPKVVSNSAGKNIELSTGAFYVRDGSIYYVGEKDGVSTLLRLDAQRNESVVAKVPSGEEKTLDISDFYVSENWAYCFCADGKANGKRIFFAISLNTNESVTIYED